MNGKFLIDGLDSFDVFGIFISQGGYNELLSYAPIKDIKYSNYNEIDGVTADLSEVYLRNKTFNIKFGILGNRTNYKNFIRHISNTSYHEFNFIDLGITEKLRYISEGKFDTNDKFTTVTVQFSDDFPVKYRNEMPRNPGIVPKAIYEIDGINLADYGIRSLEGNLNELLKNAKAKQHLTQTNAIMDSVQYTNNDVTFDGKEITLNLFMRATHLFTFWNNYRAFQRAISTAGAKTLYVSDIDSYFYFFYKSCKTKSFHSRGKIWFEFSINLQILSYLLPDDYLLITEDDKFIVTEDNKNYIKVNII